MNGNAAKPGIGVWKWLLAPWMLGVTYAAFFVAKDLRHFPDPPTARIIFWHVPVAWLCLVWFFTGTVYGIRFLYQRGGGNLDLDRRSALANEVGLICTVLATVTGMVFAYRQWNTPWNWDPKQVAISVLIIIYLAYFGLRMSIDDPQTRGRLSAVYSILGAISAPVLLFVLPHLPAVISLHPPNTTITRGLDSTWRMIWLSSLLGFTGITIWMFQLKLRAAVVFERMEARAAGTAGATELSRTEPERRPRMQDDEDSRALTAVGGRDA
jgi:heme exporter protein C